MQQLSRLNNIRHLKLINSFVLLEGGVVGQSKFNFLKLEINNNFFQLLVNGVSREHCHANQNVGGGLDNTTIAGGARAFSSWHSSSQSRLPNWTRDSGWNPRDSTPRKLTDFSFLFPTCRVVSTALLFLSLFSFPCWTKVNNQPIEKQKLQSQIFFAVFYVKTLYCMAKALKTFSSLFPCIHLNLCHCFINTTQFPWANLRAHRLLGLSQ